MKPFPRAAAFAVISALSCATTLAQTGLDRLDRTGLEKPEDLLKTPVIPMSPLVKVIRFGQPLVMPGQEPPRFTFTLGVDALLTSNAYFETDAASDVYAAPRMALSYDGRDNGRGFTAALSIGAERYDFAAPNDSNTIEAGAGWRFFTHANEAGDGARFLELRYGLVSVHDGDFSVNYINVHNAELRFGMRGKLRPGSEIQVSGFVSGSYQMTGNEFADRAQGRINLGLALPIDEVLSAGFAVDLRFQHYPRHPAGARSDWRAEAEASLSWQLDENFSAGFAVRAVGRSSNDPFARAFAIEAGPSLAYETKF